MNKNGRVIFAFAGIFVAGTVAGGLIGFRMAHPVSERHSGPGGRPGNPPSALGPPLFRRLTEQLDLTAEQREKIKPIELRLTEELRRRRLAAQHDTELVIEQATDDISAVLTPEQRTQFEERIAKGRERMKKFMQDQEQPFHGRHDPASPKRTREEPPPK